MQKLFKVIALIISVLFCLKTFFTAFYALSIYPHSYLLEIQISAYANPVIYLWVTFGMNIFALMAGFWLFAGLCENLYSFFSPALTGVLFFLAIDLLLHCVQFFIVNTFHALMIFNLCTSAFFASSMYIVYRTCKDFDDLNPEQIVHQNTLSTITIGSVQITTA